MRFLLFVIIGWIGLSGCTRQSQTPLPQAERSQTAPDDPYLYVAWRFPSGTYRASTMELNLPQEAIATMNQMNEALKGKEAWFEEYRKANKKEGAEFVPWHKDFGISKADYEAYCKEYAIGPRPIKNGEGQLIVSIVDSVMNFGSPDTLEIFSHLRLDLRKKTLQFDQTPIPYSRKITYPAKTGINGWEGHEWRLEKPGNLPGDFGVYTFIAAQLDNRKPMIILNITDMENHEAVEKGHFQLFFEE